MGDMGDLAIELIALRAIEPGKELANIAWQRSGLGPRTSSLSAEGCDQNIMLPRA